MGGINEVEGGVNELCVECVKCIKMQILADFTAAKRETQKPPSATSLAGVAKRLNRQIYESGRGEGGVSDLHREESIVYKIDFQHLCKRVISSLLFWNRFGRVWEMEIGNQIVREQVRRHGMMMMMIGILGRAADLRCRNKGINTVADGHDDGP